MKRSLTVENRIDDKEPINCAKRLKLAILFFDFWVISLYKRVLRIGILELVKNHVLDFGAEFWGEFRFVDI